MRPPATRTGQRWTLLPSALAASLAVHSLLAVLIMFWPSTGMTPNLAEPPAVTIVFTVAASEPAQAPPAAPEPDQPEPPVPPEPDLAPATPQAATTTAPAEPPPAPATAAPEPAPRPPPHPPQPRQPSRPRPGAIRPVAPSPAQPQAPPDAAAAPAQTAAPPPSVISADWRNALGAWLQAHKTYPAEAKRRGDEGRATVRFTVDREGHVLEVQLVSGTGSTLLDTATTGESERGIGLATTAAALHFSVSPSAAHAPIRLLSTYCTFVVALNF